MNIDGIKRRLLVKYPLFGNIVANTNFVCEQSVVTAETDGKDIYYNPDFINSLTDKEQTFVIAHEICHIAFDHIYRSEGKDSKIWNIATDSVINAFLKKDGLSIVKGAIDIPEAIKYDAEEIYNKLLQEKGNNNNVGHDTHSMWSKAIENKNKKEQSSIDSENSEQEIKKSTQLGEKETFKQNKIERKKQLEELRESLVSMSHGFDSNKEVRTVKDIGISKTLIDWRRILKEAVKYDIDWSYQNAEVENGVVTAYLEELPRPETEIVLDTSGSIDENLLRNFLRECKNILQNSKVKVGCFDTEFYGFTEVNNGTDIDNLEFFGGGGTDFGVAVQAFTNRVENKIIFTDGKSLMPKKSIDAIWIVFGGTKITPKGGKVINISDEQLKRLLKKSR